MIKFCTTVLYISASNDLLFGNSIEPFSSRLFFKKKSSINESFWEFFSGKINQTVCYINWITNVRLIFRFDIFQIVFFQWIRKFVPIFICRHYLARTSVSSGIHQKHTFGEILIIRYLYVKPLNHFYTKHG